MQILSMENDSITKSIIYGNTQTNKYGRFMPLCSSISNRSSISEILDYLKVSPHFRKFNRITYAYRVDQVPIVFITERRNVESQYYEGSHSDQTIEGSGEKLLHLLSKFNIRNVLVATLVQQFHPLLPFECTNYRAIVENSRMLLDELYKKVMNLTENTNEHQVNDLLLRDETSVRIRKLDLFEGLDKADAVKSMPKQRPNHIHSSKAPPVSLPKQEKNGTNYHQQEFAFLQRRAKSMQEQFPKVIESIQQRELQQIKYFALYDKSPSISMVISMFLLYEGLSKEELLEDFNLDSLLRNKQLETLPRDRLKKLDQLLKAHKKLTVDSVLRINRGLGMLFSIIQMRIRFSKHCLRLNELKQKMGISASKGANGVSTSNNAVTIDDHPPAK